MNSLTFSDCYNVVKNDGFTPTLVLPDSMLFVVYRVRSMIRNCEVMCLSVMKSRQFYQMVTGLKEK